MIPSPTDLSVCLRTALANLAPTFRRQQPYPHACGQGLFGDAFAVAVEKAVAVLPWHRVTTDFYAQDERRLDRRSETLPEPLATLLGALTPDVTTAAERLLPAKSLTLGSVVLHRLFPGDRIDIHNDANDEGEVLRLCWHFGALCQGGDFVVHTSEHDVVGRTALVPQRDAWACFAIGPNSFHSVRPVLGAQARLSLIITWSQASV